MNAVTRLSLRTVSSSSRRQAMKPGTTIAGLDFLKNQDPVVSKERTEYPEWVNKLDKPAKTLAKLRKIDMWSAEEEEQKRFLKLTRRIIIKENNLDAGLS